MIAPDSITKLTTAVVYVARDPILDAGGLLLGANLVALSRIIESPEPLPTPTGGLLMSMRNQLTVSIELNRLQFVDGSGEMPARADFPDRVHRAAEYIGRQSDQTYSAVGLNFDIEAAADADELPSKAILNRLARREAFEGTRYGVAGAATRFWYGRHDRRYDLRVEPRGNQYESESYFAHLNVHIELGREKTSEEWLSQTLREEYADFIETLTRILKSREKQT